MGIILRSAVIFAFLWIVLRAMGKRELSQLTAFDFVVLVVMGDLIQQGVTLEDMSVTGAMLSVTTMALLTAAMATAAVRWPRAGRVLEGVPVVVIQRGVVVQEALRNERLDLADLFEAARAAGIKDLRDVEWCVLESDGRFSFLRLEDTSRPPASPPGGPEVA
jgi:uncharacterized membrane protein YcaP (DUF421 family)